MGIEVVGEGVLGHHLAGVAGQVFQQAVFEGGEFQWPVVQAGLLGTGVDAQSAHADQVIRRAGRTPEQGAQARQQLRHLEGFDQVVVGAGLQALDLLLPASACGQDEDGQQAALGAKPADQLQPGQPGQAEVDHRGIEGVLLRQPQALVAVAGRIYLPALGHERLAQACLQRGLVLHHQDAHG